MIEAHTFDAWTGDVVRSTSTYRNLIILGGFAAPLFLWLAGVAAVLAAESALRRTGDRRAAAFRVCSRGLEIFVLAFLFRIQAFIVSPGNSLLSLFRVDILNIMGPSIVAASLVWGLCRRRSLLVLVYASLAIGVAMVTPLIRTAEWVEALPVWFQWHLRPAGDQTVFTGFPWAGFVFGGGAVGALLAPATDGHAEGRVHMGLLGSGATLVAVGFYTASLPPLYAQSSFWTSSPTYFAIRLGVMMMALASLYGLETLLSHWRIGLSWLARIGRNSLFIYWIHVELVYGYASWPLRRHLSLFQSATAYLLFCAMIYGAVVVKDRVVRARRIGQMTVLA
jgi:uncharacterized membrane protein